MKRAALVTIIAVGVGVVGAVAQVDPIAERNKLMSANWREGLGPIARIARGQAEFDAALVEKSFARMAEIAAQLPPLWPPGSHVTNPTTRYSSSPKVWENKADFDARLVQLANVVAQNRARAVSGPEGAKAAFEAVNQTCDGCHERYQVRNR